MSRERAQPDGVPAASATAEGPPEEVELWWGSCSPWALAPSFLVCVVLTAGVVWVSWYYFQRGWAQPVALAAGTLVWAVQLYRWGRRVFGWNYRLTTRRILVARGVLRMRFAFVDLRDVGTVLVAVRRWERWFGLGSVLVWREGQAAAALRLEGLTQPQRVADQIREAVQQARAAPAT